MRMLVATLRVVRRPLLFSARGRCALKYTIYLPRSHTCVHTKFEADLCTWAASRTVDVSRFRVGRTAAACERRSPPAAAGRRLGHTGGRRRRDLVGIWPEPSVIVARAHIGLQQQHRLVLRPTGFLRAMAVAGRARAARKCQIVREVGYLLRLDVRRSQVSGDRLVRSAAADWPARCPAATPVPNREPVPLGRRAEHAWIAD